MKSTLLIAAVFISILVTLEFFSCRKADKTNVPGNQIDSAIKMTSCAGPDYGDSIIFGKWKGPHNDYTIKPKKIKDNGRFFAWPEGMVIDPLTGEINVTQSEAGIRYKVGFVKSGTTDTCFTTLILGGITYVDAIYSMEANDTLAKPYYYANPATAPVCDGSDDTDYPGQGNPGGNANCEFDDDDDDDNGNGKDDEPPPGQRANDKKLKVRTKSGVINLKKSLNEGIFGPNPQNGDNKLVTIYYRLNDKSGKALQSITIQVWYYNKRSDVPAAQQNTIINRQTSFQQYQVVNGKPRPPMIILTSFSD